MSHAITELKASITMVYVLKILKGAYSMYPTRREAEQRAQAVASTFLDFIWLYLVGDMVIEATEASAGARCSPSRRAVKVDAISIF